MLDSYAWMIGRQIADTQPPFYALIVAAMYNADTQNAARLRLAFPDVAERLERFEKHAPTQTGINDE